MLGGAARATALALDRSAHTAAREMVVDDPAGLHHGVGGSGTDEPEAARLELARKGPRLVGLRRHVRIRARRSAPSAQLEGPDQIRERPAVRSELHRRTGVRDRRVDLRAVADDRRVRQQPLRVARAEAGHLLDLEAGERRPECLALAKDREPGQTRLEGLQAELLVETAVVANGPPPLVVVVGDVLGGGERPAAARLAVRAGLEIAAGACLGHCGQREGSGGAQAPWHFLYFLPEPHQHGSLRPILSRSDLTTVAGFSLEAPLPPPSDETAAVPTAAAPAAGAAPGAVAACEASSIADGCSGPPPA